MRITVATWNMQGWASNITERRKVLDGLLARAEVVFLQESGKFCDGIGNYNGAQCVGVLGGASDGSANDRVSLAIISRFNIEDLGFQEAETRGLLYIICGNRLFGTWHEKRGAGGLGTCLNSLLDDGKITPQTPCTIGGDFNDVKATPIRCGSSRRGTSISLESSSYNLFYSDVLTHPGSEKNLDRVFVSRPALSLVHQWSEHVFPSDHNPVLATTIDSAGDMTRWERLKAAIWDRR